MHWKIKQKKKMIHALIPIQLQILFPHFAHQGRREGSLPFIASAGRASRPCWAVKRGEEAWILNKIRNWKISNPRSRQKKSLIRGKHRSRAVHAARRETRSRLLSRLKHIMHLDSCVDQIFGVVFAGRFVHVIVLLLDFLITGETGPAVFVSTADVFLLSICSHFLCE